MGILGQLLFVGLSLADDADPQQAKSIHDVAIETAYKNTSLAGVFADIESKTDFVFTFDKKDPFLKERFSKPAGSTTVASVLKDISRTSKLVFQQINNNISVRRQKDEEKVEAPPVIISDAIDVSGRVTSSSDGLGIPGVNILVKGTGIGTVTDVDGNYNINVANEEDILVFSAIGYITQEMTINGRGLINVTMVEDMQNLDEVVVVGYGVQKKETLTGSVTSVKGSDIIQSPVINVSNSLAGRLSGVTAVTRSAEPGNDATTIRIRGSNTLGNNSALIVVDGIPGRSLDRIDPNSIESISVLKDASAAIYGAQAANGVILVTTKRGKAGKPNVEVNFNQGFVQPTRLPNLTNAADYATALNEVDMYSGRPERYTAEDIQKFSDGSDPWGHPNTDWFDATYKNLSKQVLGNVNISGGSEYMRYFVSMGAKSQDAYYKNSATKYNQYDLRTNFDADISKNISIGLDVAGRIENKNYPTRSSSEILNFLMRGKPTMPAYWPNGLPGPDIEYGNNPVVISTNQTGFDKDKRYVINSNFRLNIKIPAVEGLSLSGNAAFDKNFRFRKTFEIPWYLYSWDGQTFDANEEPALVRSKRGINDPNLTQYGEDNQSVLLNGLINYEKIIALDHNIKFLAGVEFRSGMTDMFSAYRRYFVSTALAQLNFGGTDEINNSGTASHSARFNYFGRVNYNYKEKYLAEFVWRVDGSYIFPEAGRFGFFPGISLGWRLSEENFWQQNLSFISDFKLRASYGQTGNDRIDEWQYLSTYGFGNRNKSQVFDITQESPTLFEARIANPNVTWEVANQANIGFDAYFLNNKISVVFDYFNYLRTNILWQRNASVPSSTGLTLPRENIGKVANRGFDFDIAYRDHVGGINYQVSVNGGYAKNEIIFWDESPGAPEYQQSTGRPMNSDLYYQAIGIFNDQEELDAYPSWSGARAGDIIFEDINGDNKIDANDRVRNDKSNLPTFQAGLGLNLQYKQFNFSALFQGSAGAVRYFSTASGDFGNYRQFDFDGRWTPDNVNADKPRTSNRTDEYWKGNRNTYFLHKSDFIRLKNIEFGYNLPPSFNERLGLQSFRIFVSGFNLLTYSVDLKDLDPEGDSESNLNYPLQKVMNLGLSVNF